MHAKPASWLVIIEALAIEHCTAKDNNNNNTRQQGNARQGETRQDEVRRGTDTGRWARSKRPQGNTKWPTEEEEEEQELRFDLAPRSEQGLGGGGVRHSLKPSHASLTPSLTNGLKGRGAISQYNCHATFCILSCLQKSKSHITSYQAKGRRGGGRGAK